MAPALAGRVAFITGGASGIGFGMARAFAEAGMKLALADVDEPALDRACAELGEGTLGVACDVTERASLEAAADAAWNAFGGVHVLCNNAGVAGGGGPLDQVADADWRWLLAVNLEGVVNALQTFLPRLREQGEGGHVVNTASLAGLFAPPNLGVYNTTKFAVVGLSETLRQDLEPHGIGVSVLCPGLVRTNIGESGRHRPERFGGPRPVPAGAGAVLAQRGMDPLEVGRCVRRGVEANRLYILTHPGARERVEARLRAILRAFDEPA